MQRTLGSLRDPYNNHPRSARIDEQIHPTNKLLNRNLTDPARLPRTPKPPLRQRNSPQTAKLRALTTSTRPLDPARTSTPTRERSPSSPPTNTPWTRSPGSLPDSTRSSLTARPPTTTASSRLEIWITPELSGRCRVPHDSTARHRSGPLERIVSPLPQIRISSATRPSDRWRHYC
jgi:hypothetical protein